MQDDDFLRQALKQAFAHPLTDLISPLCMRDYAPLTACLHFCDNRCTTLLPFTLPCADIKLYSQISESAVHKLHNPSLYREYETYKHDISENIVVPTDFPNSQKIIKKLMLSRLSRQAAQKKKVSATIFPAEFINNFPSLDEKYCQSINLGQEILRQNPSSYHISLINDFAALYKKTIGGFIISNPILWLNKKRFRYYLNEAAQLLKSHQDLSADFYASHSFIGENNRFTRKKVLQVKNKFSALLFLLPKMTNEPQLLSLVQILLADKKKYQKMLHEYSQNHNCDNLSQITALHHNMQDLFNKYAFLTYLDGVRFAFENKYLEECPQQRHQALPTVSPQDEVQKIIQIVEESKKTTSVSGRTKQIYLRALKNFDTSLKNLNTLLEKMN